MAAKSVGAMWRPGQHGKCATRMDQSAVCAFEAWRFAFPAMRCVVNVTKSVRDVPFGKHTWSRGKRRSTVA